MSATLEPFEGTIGRTHQDSTPWWPEIPVPSEGSPNVLVILLDDTGFAHFGCYGCSVRLGDDGAGREDAYPLQRTELVRKKRTHSCGHLHYPLFGEFHHLCR